MLFPSGYPVSIHQSTHGQSTGRRDSSIEMTTTTTTTTSGEDGRRKSRLFHSFSAGSQFDRVGETWRVDDGSMTSHTRSHAFDETCVPTDSYE